MTTAIGVAMTEHIVAGRMEDHKIAGKLLRYPAEGDELDALSSVPAGELVEILAGHIAALNGNGQGAVEAIGVAVPGVVRHGVVEEAPNLTQLKGMRLAEELGRALKSQGIDAPVYIANDADAIAAGVAATRGQLNKLTRVWTIGNGIGYGRWPYVEGVWEGGHITVTLDPKERFCGCGGVGHLEGIMGYRAMRMRFLDLSPKRSSPTPKRATRAAANLSTCGIARWLRARPRSFTWPARGASISPGTTWSSWSCRSCAAILKPWSR